MKLVVWKRKGWLVKNTMSQGISCWITLILSLQRRNEPVAINGVTHCVLEEKKLSLICGTRVSHVLRYATTWRCAVRWYPILQTKVLALVCRVNNFCGDSITVKSRCTYSSARLYGVINRVTNVCLYSCELSNKKDFSKWYPGFKCGRGLHNVLREGFSSIPPDKLPDIALEAVVVFSGSLLLHVFKMFWTLLNASGVGCGEVWHRSKHCNCKEGHSF